MRLGTIGILCATGLMSVASVAPAAVVLTVTGHDIDYMAMSNATNSPPTAYTDGEPVGGDTSGGSFGNYTDRYAYFDFGADWANLEITETWTKYREWSSIGATPFTFVEMWWDDDFDKVNDGILETGISLISAANFNSNGTMPWVRDTDANANPIPVQGRYLIVHSASTGLHDRAQEVAFIGNVVPEPATAGLLAMGAGLLALRRRRNA